MGNEHCSLRGSPGGGSSPGKLLSGGEVVASGCLAPLARLSCLPHRAQIFILFTEISAGGFCGSARAASTCGLLGDNTQGHTDLNKVVCVPTPYRGAPRPCTAPVGPRGGTGKTLREPRVPHLHLNTSHEDTPRPESPREEEPGAGFGEVRAAQSSPGSRGEAAPWVGSRSLGKALEEKPKKNTNA